MNFKIAVVGALIMVHSLELVQLEPSPRLPISVLSPSRSGIYTFTPVQSPRLPVRQAPQRPQISAGVARSPQRPQTPRFKSHDRPVSPREPPKPPVPRGRNALRSMVKRIKLRRKNKPRDKSEAGSENANNFGGAARKTSKYKKARSAVVQGLAFATDAVSQAVGIAFQVQSLRTLQSMTPAPPSPAPLPSLSSSSSSISDEFDSELKQGRVSYSRNSLATEDCPAAIENAFISVYRQACPSSDPDVAIDKDRSFQSYESEHFESGESASPSENVSELKVCPTLHLRFYDVNKTKGYGRTGSFVCRRAVKAVTDSRPAFVQSLEVVALQDKPLLSSSSKVTLARQASIACADKRLPLSALRPGAPRDQPKARSTLVELDDRGVVRLQYTGIINKTPSVKNTCHLDSFLTYFLIRCRNEPSYLTRNLLISGSAPENVLKELCLRYSKFTFGQAVIATRRIQADWKKLWLISFFPDFQDAVMKNKNVDFRGHETESVAEVLEKSLVWMGAYSCSCRTSQDKYIARKSFFPAWTIEQLIVMSRFGTSDQSQPLNLKVEFEADYCVDCGGHMKLQFIFVPTTTWFLYFQLGSKSGPSTKVTQIPLKFRAHELYYEVSVDFHLGYISMSTKNAVAGVIHQLAFMFFENRYYFYDDENKGHLIRTSDPDAKAVSDQLTVQAAVYFRR